MKKAEVILECTGFVGIT